MTVFKNYFKIVKGHMKVILIYSLFFLLLVAFSNNLDKDTQYKSVDVDIYVKDKANTKLSKALYEYLDENANIVEMRDDLVDDNLFYEVIKAVVIIPSDFDNSRQVSYKTAPKSMYGMEIEYKLNQFISKVNTYENAGFTESRAIEAANKDLSKKLEVSLNNKAALETDDDSNFYFNFLNYMIMAQVILIISTIVAVYQKESLAQRNAVSPVPASKQSLQLTLGHIAVGLCIWLSYMLVFAILWRGSIGKKHVNLLMLNSFFFTISVVTMAVFISHLVKNNNAREGIMNVISLGSSFLAGAFVPQEMLGKTALTLARVLPSYYYISNNNLITQAPSLSAILPNIYIMCGFSLAFIALAMLTRRRVG